MEKFDLLIIGGGITGMTAAIYAARANLSVCILEKEVCGGLVNWTHTVENVPSYKTIHGIELMEKSRDHVESLGVTIVETVKKYRQITTAMADGTIAALEAEKHIRS